MRWMYSAGLFGATPSSSASASATSVARRRCRPRVGLKPARRERVVERGADRVRFGQIAQRHGGVLDRHRRRRRRAASRRSRNTRSFGPTPSIIASSGVGRNTPRSSSRELAAKPRSRMSSVKLVRRDEGWSTRGVRAMNEGAGAMAVKQHAFGDEIGDRLAQRRARNVEQLAQVALAGQQLRSRRSGRVSISRCSASTPRDRASARRRRFDVSWSCAPPLVGEARRPRAGSRRRPRRSSGACRHRGEIRRQDTGATARRGRRPARCARRRAHSARSSSAAIACAAAPTIVARARIAAAARRRALRREGAVVAGLGVNGPARHPQRIVAEMAHQISRASRSSARGRRGRAWRRAAPSSPMRAAEPSSPRGSRGRR